MALSLLLLTLLAFVVSILLTPVIRDIALRIGWVDRPDSDRKLHNAPVPRVGGIPIFLAYSGALVLLLASMRGDGPIFESSSFIWKVLLAGALVFLVGLLDDIFNLKPWQKLVGQLVAAGMACSAGVRIDHIAGHEIGYWAIPVTLLWLIVCTNAFNLIDGADGVASGIGLFATVTTFTAALLHGDIGLALATGPLVGALLGFLRYNVSPASVFLGDAGSLWMGFLLGCYGVMWSHKCTTVLGITAPLMAFAIPLLDTALAVARRFLGSRPIFGADRGHIHHRLLDRGQTPRRVALILYGASGLAACFALLQSVVQNQYAGIVFVLFCAAMLAGIQYLRYQEFEIVARLIRGVDFRGTIAQQLRLARFEEALASAKDIDASWPVIRDAARGFGFNSVHLHLGDRSYSDDFRCCQDNCWTLNVPLSDSAHVHLTHPVDPPHSAVGPFAGILHRTLPYKLVLARAAASSERHGRAVADVWAELRNSAGD